MTTTYTAGHGNTVAALERFRPAGAHTVNGAHRWDIGAPCGQHPGWFELVGHKFTLDNGRAVHECRRHCPVRDLCHARVGQLFDRHLILDGRVWTRHNGAVTPAAEQPTEARCGACIAATAPQMRTLTSRRRGAAAPDVYRRDVLARRAS